MKFHLQADISMADIAGDPTGDDFLQWLRAQLMERLGDGQCELALGNPFTGMTLADTLMHIDKVGAVRLD